MEQRPTIGIGAEVYIIKEGRVLLGKRLGEFGSGKWCAPGGHIERYETAEAAAVREVKEETGLVLTHATFLGYVEDIHPEKDDHFVALSFRANWTEGEPKILEPHKFEKWEWFDWEHLPSPLFWPVENLIKSGINPTKI